MLCPKCGKEAKTVLGLKKHLMGGASYGGHELSAPEAEHLVLQAASAIAAQLTAQKVKPTAPPYVRNLPRVVEYRRVATPPASTNPFENFVYELFTGMARNKPLPKYQLERRVDAILNVFLPDLLQAVYGWKIDIVAPEFPLKKPDNNQSTNLDYLLFRHGDTHITASWLFFELKTDTASIKDSQIGSYLAAVKKGMKQLFSDVETIALSPSADKQKYGKLLDRFAGYPLDAPLEMIYLSPSDPKIPDPAVHVLLFSQLKDVQLTRHSEAWDLFRSIVLPVLS